jgi:hypothetical protein
MQLKNRDQFIKISFNIDHLIAFPGMCELCNILQKLCNL